MRVLRVKHKKKLSLSVLVGLGLTSLGLLIGGGITGNVFLVGAGVAGLLFTCVGFLGTRRNTPETSIY